MNQFQEKMLKEIKAEVAAREFDLGIKVCKTCRKEFTFVHVTQERCEDCGHNRLQETYAENARIQNMQHPSYRSFETLKETLVWK